ncbi:hypothetical protein HF521_021035, partial [Silurus meridionalis]
KKNILVQCKLCLPGSKLLSTAINSNSNLFKHLQKLHASTRLDANPNLTPEVSLTPPAKQQRLCFNQTVSQGQINKAIERYVVENMQPVSTVESPAFRQLVSMITCSGRTQQMGRKSFSNYLDKEYSKMESVLKTTFEGLQYIATTADIWSVHNKSFLGLTAHWINTATLQCQKAALACKRIKGRHAYDVIAAEIDHIHSLYGLSTKVTATVTDNGCNFVKAFQMYQPESLSDDDDNEEDEEVTFTNVADVLDTSTEEGIVFPPHQRCASHTLNLIPCSDVDKWLLSNPGTKGIYRSATAKCTALWSKASRSTLASELDGDLVGKKLLVPCSTRWNSFYDAVVRIVEIPMADLSTISNRLELKCIGEREFQFLREYCAIMKPLTVALDILQGEENCYYGTLLPTIEVLMSKLLEIKEGLIIATGLPDAIVQVRNIHQYSKEVYGSILESNDAILAAVTLLMFKLRWLRHQRKKDMVKGVSQAHSSPWPCLASSQDARVSDNTRLKLLQCAGLFMF